MTEEGGRRGPDPDRSRACAGCGWSGPETAMRAAGAGELPGAGDPGGADLACPRCGAASVPDMPSVAEILAARRAPLPER